jgi:hypothetical protein
MTVILNESSLAAASRRPRGILQDERRHLVVLQKAGSG